MCSCMAGYTLMADGVSCEGECFGLPTETWLSVRVPPSPGCSSSAQLWIAVSAETVWQQESQFCSQVPPEAQRGCYLATWRQAWTGALFL